MKNAAADIGYGWTKALVEGQTEAFKQPSVLGEPKQLFEESRRPTDIIYNGKYFVGDLALRHSDVRYAGTKESKPETWTTEVLLKVALGMTVPEESVNLVTGLPIDFYHSQCGNFRDMIGRIDRAPYQLEVGRRVIDCSPQIENVKIVPQHLGAAMDFLLDSQGQVVDKGQAGKSILVVDPGYFTLGLLPIEGMEIGKERCSPPGLGADAAYKLIQDYLREKTGNAPPRYDMDAIYAKGDYRGYDIKPLFAKAFKALASQIELEVESLNKRYDIYLLVGGTGLRIREYLTLPNLLMLPDPQAANVRGYLKIAARLWGTHEDSVVRLPHRKAGAKLWGNVSG